MHGIVVDYDLAKGGTHLMPIDDFSILAVENLLNSDIKMVDFAMKKFAIPMPPCKLLINTDIEGDFKRVDRIALTSDFSILPEKQEEYGFCGLVQPKIIPLIRTHESAEAKISKGLSSNLIYYDNVRYFESKDDCHVFTLENKGYSHDSFRGTSGAPIIDSKGNLVSLVMSGTIHPTDPNKWLINGVNLSKLSTVVDVNCDLI